MSEANVVGYHGLTRIVNESPLPPGKDILALIREANVGNLADVLDEVRAERTYQDNKWGGASHDDNEESQNSFINYILEYASGINRAEKYDFRTRMIKVAALAVAAVQRNDRIESRTSEGSPRADQ